MQDEDEAQASGVAIEINLDAIEEVLGDDTVLTEEDDEIIIKLHSDDNDDDDLDIAFTDDEGHW